MRKTYKYRIHLTRKQEAILKSQLESCRMLYNQFLSERKNLWETEGKNIRLYDQQNSIPALKKECPPLKDIHSLTVQNVAVRVDLAYAAFFRRVRLREKELGYPRFKGTGRYDSLTFPQYGNGVKVKDGRLVISKIGHIKMVMHRPLEGTPKTAVIKRSSTGKWYVSFSCEMEKPAPLPNLNNSVGIDVGLETFAFLSDNTKIENPRFFKKEEQALAKANRKLDSVTKKDKNGKVLNGKDPIRLRVKKALSRTHERVKFKRDDFSHQESRKIINNYQIIAIEDLEVNRLKERSFKPLRKSISDVAWFSFFNLLNVKAEEAGRSVIAVNPAYTSQDCSRCRHREKKSLAERIHKCKNCGLTIHRDLNASINIESLGLQALGIKSLEAPTIPQG